MTKDFKPGVEACIKLMKHLAEGYRQKAKTETLLLGPMIYEAKAAALDEVVAEMLKYQNGELQ